MRWVLALPLLLAGCADSITIGYQHTSSQWEVDGAWAALPDGQHGKFTVTTESWFGYDNDFTAPDLPWPHDMRFVRWENGHEEFQTLQFEGKHVQVWTSEHVTQAEARETFMEIAPTILAGDLDTLWSRMVGNSKLQESYNGNPPQWAYGASYERPDFERLYNDLGGMETMVVLTTLDASGGLPIPSQLTLHSGHWKLYMEAAAKRVQTGTSPNGELLWVSPTDTLQYVHWGRSNMTSADATRELQSTLRAMDLDDTSPGWSFTVEPIKRSLGGGD